MIRRYTPPEIASIFSDESRLRRWLDIEILVAEGWAQAGKIPQDSLPALRQAKADPVLVAALEAEQGHDLAAFVAAISQSVGDVGRYFHLGLTSSDIVDTALATQLRDAWRFIDEGVQQLEDLLVQAARQHRHTVMMGRTHGVHAEPITLGVKFVNFLDEIRRSRSRLKTAAAEISVGKISGPVGTYSSVHPAVEEHVCTALDLQPVATATQVVARDRHASFVTAMAILGTVLERIATSVRLLQISEVGELEEPFSQQQKGSSAMPHKRNPILSERICGLARLLRGNAQVAMEDVALWHERDISHSSAERIILPDSCAALAYMLQLSCKIIGGMHVDSQRMLENTELHGGIVFSQRLLNFLIAKAEWPREDAYRTVQALAAQARQPGGNFRELAQASPELQVAVSGDDWQEIFDLRQFLGEIDAVYARLGLSQ